jgi:hypothetical protein
MQPIDQALPDAVRCDRLRATLSVGACRARYRKSTQAPPLTMEALWPCRQCPDGAARCVVAAAPVAPEPKLPRVCERCGQSNPRKSSPHCFPCADALRRERRQERRSARATGITCERCQVQVPRTSSRQRFCRACSAVHHEEQRLDRARARAEARRAQVAS